MDPGDASIEHVRHLQDLVARERRAREQAEQAHEQATRELGDRQRELALLVAVTRAANDSRDVEAALGRAIGCICAHTGWPVGHVFLADPAVGLRPAAIWHLDRPERFETFRRITEATTLASGESLGGRVLASGSPEWLADVTTDPGFAQARVDPDLGVRAGFGFPILVGREVVGVMEFFTDAVRPPDEALLDLMGQLGTELGRAIERDRASAAQTLLHRELIARATELESSNAELEQFASIASHDLQEPLRKVRTFNQRVLETESTQLSERGRDYLERANSSAARMQALIEDLLAFSRVATRGRDFLAVDLGQVTADVRSELEATVTRTRAAVHVGSLPTIDADEAQMRQLMQSLLSNALKFHDEAATPEVTIEADVHDGVAQITVRDNGIGFEPRYRERIFRVFERLHGRSAYGGTGIGLALARKIVERHDGSLHADGELGVGSTFTVTLPVHRPSTADLLAAAGDAVPAAGA